MGALLCPQTLLNLGVPSQQSWGLQDDTATEKRQATLNTHTAAFFQVSTQTLGPFALSPPPPHSCRQHSLSTAVCPSAGWEWGGAAGVRLLNTVPTRGKGGSHSPWHGSGRHPGRLPRGGDKLGPEGQPAGV